MNTTTPVLFVTLNFFKKSNLKTTIKKKTNPCFRIWWILGADFLPLVGCEIFFPGKNCREAEYMVFSWQELRWVSYPYTQISQSFTSSRCRNPQCALLIHSAWRRPLHSYSCVLLHYGFWLSISPYDCKPTTKNRSWVKVLGLSDTLLWLHPLCLPSTAGPDCPASQRNTENRGNPTPQWTMVETPGAPLSTYLSSSVCWPH